MKRVLLSVCALALIVTSLGCACSCDNCKSRRHAAQSHAMMGQGRGGNCGPQCRPGGGLCGHGNQVAPMGAAGVAYPYYTTRGPRDFLSANPRGIGP